MTKYFQYRTPNGTLIIGSKDTVPCRADIDWFDKDGEPEWSGNTEVFWDDQKTEARKIGKKLEPIYLDEEGDEFVLSECTREPYKPEAT